MGVSKDGYRILGSKKFELNNHLANVLTVTTDGINISTDSTWATIVSSRDYYPFGLEMKGRTWTDTTSLYRFGFNGKEKDEKGEFGKTTYDYGFRIYNPSIAKFLSVDPLTTSYPWYTPYQFAGNTPIRFIDVDGAEPLDPMGMQMHYFYIAKNAESVGENGFEAVKMQSIQETEARLVGTATGLVLLAAPHAGRWLLGNWHHLLYNPLIHNEIAATIYGSIADDEWPIPAVGDNASKTVRVTYKALRGPMELTSTLLMHKGASFANDAERSIAIYLTKQGHNVDILQEAAQTKELGQTADFLVDGIKTEVKSIGDVADATSDGISYAIKDRLSQASEQAKSIIIDLREQQGATLEIAKRGVIRYFGQSKGNTQSVRVIGDGFDEIITNSKKQ